MEENMRDELRTLVGTLRSQITKPCDSSIESDDRVNRDYIDQTINDIRLMLVNKTLELQERIKNARPFEDDFHYETKIRAYRNLLEIAESLLIGMQQSFEETLDHYRQFIDRIWNDIVTNEGMNVDNLVNNYSFYLNTIMNNTWVKYFEAVEQRLIEISAI
ncbi:hypothetical protein I4U23_004600 [Adineta vaga]|nr:hypothetical protein I4U23_004600 [Adineta vaga]